MPPSATSAGNDSEWVFWLATLQGSVSDLAEVAHWTDGNSIHARKAADGSYELVLPVSIVGMDEDLVRQCIRQQLIGLNALGVFFGNSFEGVKAKAGLVTIDSTGTRRHFYVRVSSVTSTSRVGRPTFLFNGQPTVDPTKGMAALAIAVAQASPALMDALQIVGRPAPTWAELYVAYELVEGNSGVQVIKAGWATKAESSCFTQTANSRAALGTSARHGHGKIPPPSSPMALTDAKALVRRLVSAWLQHETRQKM